MNTLYLLGGSALSEGSHATWPLVSIEAMKAFNAKLRLRSQKMKAMAPVSAGVDESTLAPRMRMAILKSGCRSADLVAACKSASGL